MVAIAKCTDGPQATHVCGHSYDKVMISYLLKLLMIGCCMVAPGAAAQEGVANCMYFQS